MNNKHTIHLSDGSILTITAGGDRDITISADYPIAIIPRAVHRCKIVLLNWNEQRIREIEESIKA